MRLTLIAVAVAAGSLAAHPALALTFNWSYVDNGRDSITIVGTVGDLTDNATSPGLVDIVFNPNAGASVGVGTYIGMPGVPGGAAPGFTVVNGAITAFHFLGQKISEGPGDQEFTLQLDSLLGSGLASEGGRPAANFPVTFTPVLRPGPAPIPLPAPIALLGAALASLMVLARRRLSVTETAA